ncbi:MAG TPA: diguanylate cyclase [Buttiauxella sp.]
MNQRANYFSQKWQMARENRQFLLMSLFGLVIGLVLFAYSTIFRQISISEKVATGLGNILADDMLHNENFSDVVSMMYLRMKSHNEKYSLFKPEYDSKNKIYGVNLSSAYTDDAFQGTLQSQKPITSNAILIARGIDFAVSHEGKYPHNNQILRRYFLSTLNDYIYLLNKTPTSDYIFAHYGGKGFDIASAQENHNYLDGKLIDSVGSSAGKISNIYDDVLTGKPTLSIEHYIYDQSEEDAPAILGAICLDYEIDAFVNTISKLGFPAGKRYLNLSIYDRLKNTKYSLLDNGSGSGLSGFEINKRYVFYASVNPVAFYLSSDGIADVLIFFIFAVLFCVICLVNYLYVSKHKKAAMTDPLTSLYNRKWLISWEKNKSAHEKYIVTLIDCNKFKEINDTYGHGVGDDALKYIASCLRSQTRTGSDYAVRTGGDEFIVLFRTSNVANAYESMRQVSAQLLKFKPGLPLSVSYGFAPLNKDIPMISAIALADQRMYNHKKSHAHNK